MRTLIISTFFLLWIAVPSYCQIHFEQYANYSLTVDELNNGDLDFGQLVSGSGPHSIDISGAKIIEITGVEYLDVIIEVNFDDLYLNGNPANTGDYIPFDLEAAYANNKGTPNIGSAKYVTNISGKSFTQRFPILERQSQPPGPPPPPPTNAFDQSQVEETAYLYLFGSIDVGDIAAGNYSSQITVTVSYD